MDTIIRVRRKRGAEPAEALVLSLKKARTEEGNGDNDTQKVVFSLWRGATMPQEAVGDAEERHRLIDWHPEQRGGEAAGESAKIKDQSEVVAADRREGVDENVELSFVSDEAIGAVGEVEKTPKKRDDDVILCNGAPLRAADQAAAAAAQPECDDVFDFYRVAHPNGELVFEDKEEKDFEIAVATRQEMLAYIGAMEGVDVESEPDSEDSNDENNWRNDYPDESSEDEDAEDYDYGRRRRRPEEYGDEEYGSSDSEQQYGGEDTEDSGEDELAEGWRNFRIG